MAKVKGSALEGVVRFLRHHREAAENMLATPLLHYLDARVSTSAWYPEEDLVELIRATLRLIPGSRDEVLEEMGRQTARDHHQGTYGHLIEGSDLTNLGIRGFALWGAMHDSGEMAVIEEAPGRVRLMLGGYGHPSDELCKTSRGYILEVLRLNGIVARAEKLHCVVKGDPACVWDLHVEGDPAAG